MKDNLPSENLFEGWAPKISVARSSNNIWDIPSLYDFHELQLNPGAMALQFGASIFEGMKAYRIGSKVNLFRLSLNYRRFQKSAQRLCLNFPSFDIFIKSVYQVCSELENWNNPFPSKWMYIRPVLIGLDSHMLPIISKEYLFYVLAAPIREFKPKEFTLSVINHFHRATPGGLGFAKTGANYAHQFLATEQAQKQGADAVLWLSSIHDGMIEEASTMNIFFRINNKIITPKLRDTILSGVTRQSVIELIQSNTGLEMEERDVFIEEIKNAILTRSLKEIFITSTALGVKTVDNLLIEGEKFNVSIDPTLSNLMSYRLKKIFSSGNKTYSSSESWIQSIELKGI